MAAYCHTNPPPCPYCNAKAELCRGRDIYTKPSILKHVGDQRFWRCQPCNAWVGCHQTSKGKAVPLGNLANAQLRLARQKAHAVFDPLWQYRIKARATSKKDSRTAAYRWLAEQLGIPVNQCHISWFDEETCKKVVEICQPHYQKLREAA